MNKNTEREQFEIILKPVAVRDYDEATQVILKVGVQQFNINEWCKNLEQAKFMENCLHHALSAIAHTNNTAEPVEPIATIRINGFGEHHTQVIYAEHPPYAWQKLERGIVHKLYTTQPSQSLAVREIIEKAAKIVSDQFDNDFGNYLADEIRALIEPQPPVSEKEK